MESAKVKITKFIFLYIFVVTFLYFTSYKLIMNDFENLEQQQNKNQIITILKSLDATIETIKNINTDYGSWNETYEYMTDRNFDYIESQFGDFSDSFDTLESLGLDFMVFATNTGTVVAPIYSNDLLEQDRVAIEKSFIQKFTHESESNAIFQYKEHSLYLIKTPILKSDGSGEPNGYIYTGKVITNEDLNNINSFYDAIYISHNESKTKDSELHLNFLKNVRIKTTYLDNTIENNIQLYNNENTYAFSITTKSQREIVINGEKTIITYNTLIGILLFVIFFILYKNQYRLSKTNEQLEKAVLKRTVELEASLKQVQHQNIELDNLANLDFLTKIKNRRSFFHQSSLALQKAIDNKTNFSILMIDLDYFKRINDQYGHAIGDKVLISFCDIVNGIIDKDAIFGRVGGEEFCIAFPEKSAEEVNEIAQKIRLKCESITLVIDKKEIAFTISLGLSEREDFNNIDQIIHVADELLYQAKHNGKNRLFRAGKRC